LFAAAAQEQRALVTRDVRDFRPVARETWAAGGMSFGLVLVSRGRPSKGAWLVAALDRLLSELPADDDLVVRRGGEVWVGPLDSP
jgi:hypothetical protein